MSLGVSMDCGACGRLCMVAGMVGRDTGDEGQGLSVTRGGRGYCCVMGGVTRRREQRALEGNQRAGVSMFQLLQTHVTEAT